MSLGLIWIAVSALAWAASDALRKRLAGPMGPVALGWWLSIGSLPVFLIWVVSSGAASPEQGYWPWGIATFACTLAATLLMLAALAIADLGVAVPMLALTPVFSAFTAWITLGEQLTLPGWVGVVLVVVGAVGLQLHGRRWSPDRGAWMMVGVALLWSLSAVFDKAAVRHAAVPVHAALQVGGSALVLGPWLLLRGRRRTSSAPSIASHPGGAGLWIGTGRAAARTAELSGEPGGDRQAGRGPHERNRARATGVRRGAHRCAGGRRPVDGARVAAGAGLVDGTDGGRGPSAAEPEHEQQR